MEFHVLMMQYITGIDEGALEADSHLNNLAVVRLRLHGGFFGALAITRSSS